MDQRSRKYFRILTAGFPVTSRCLSAEMVKRRYGSIVNISSIYRLVGPDFRIYEGTEIKPCPANYSFTKAGMVSFTKYLATYFAEHNVRVNCICFGGVYSGQSEAFLKN
jgi:NAD(P)-dependent dehydrogenase (short-subunit alcohol dehydrogenase family)